MQNGLFLGLCLLVEFDSISIVMVMEFEENYIVYFAFFACVSSGFFYAFYSTFILFLF